MDGRREKLEHEPAAVTHTVGVGADDHPWFHLARAGGYQRARSLELHDADTADVDRRQRLEIAERRRVDAQATAGVKNRRAFGHAPRPAVDAQRDLAEGARHQRVSGANTRSFRMAVWTALDAVWPRPQIDASRIACARSSISATS